MLLKINAKKFNKTLRSEPHDADTIVPYSSHSKQSEDGSVASKQSTLSLPTLNLFSKISLMNRSSHSCCSVDNLKLSPFKSSRNGRRPDYSYTKFECEETSDQFDLSTLEQVLEQASQELSPRKKNHESFATETTVDMDHSDSESLAESPLTPSSCHIPAECEGLAQVMINTDDPTHRTIWVQSPDARQHLELNVCGKTPMAPKTPPKPIVKLPRRSVISKPPLFED